MNQFKHLNIIQKFRNHKLTNYSLIGPYDLIKILTSKN
jgi:hypothetical protein